MDFTELLKKIESGETTASDAEWLSNWEADTRMFIGKQAVRYALLVMKAEELLYLIEEEPYRLTSKTFCNSDKAEEAIKQLKDALEKS